MAPYSSPMHTDERRSDGKAGDQIEDVDALMIREMNQMSIHERDHTYQDIHGVKAVVPEPKEFVEGKLIELQGEIDLIEPKVVYDQAMALSRSYVLDTKFRLKFLRAERFDARKAAARLMNYLQGKLRYFGPNKLTKDLTQSDLNEDDLAALKSCHLQFLPERDRGGRRVICDLQAMEPCGYKHHHNMIRAFIYLYECAAEDEETQKRGIVLIFFKINAPVGVKNPTPELAREAPQVIEWAPVRLAGAHMCLDDPAMKIQLQLLLLSAGREFRARYRLHDGTHTEALYALLSFGIAVDSFPITSEGSLRRTFHTKWLGKRKAKEWRLKRQGTSISAFKGIDVPGCHDVLIGKGKPIQMHSGNMELRALVANFWDEYSAAKKGSKGVVIQKVLQVIKGESGRFLARDIDGWWLEVSEDEALEKVTKTFLSAGTKVKRGVPLSTKSSSTSPLSTAAAKRFQSTSECCF